MNNWNNKKQKFKPATKTSTKSTDTSWQKVAGWYSEHLEDSESFHQAIIIPQLLSLISKYLPVSKETKILDLACGQGILTRELAAEGYQVLGVDTAKSLLKIAQDKYPNNSSISYKLADAERITPNELGQFDLIVCVLAMQNFANLEKVIQNCSQLLNKKGKLVFVINHPCFRIPRQSGWGWDEARKLQYRRMDSYASSQKIPIQLRPFKSQYTKQVANPVTWTFHHSLADYFKYLEQAKFSIKTLQEWYSHKQSQLGKTGKAENKARDEFPMFLTIIAELN